ncbi:MAG: hypothetical protein IKL20_00865 [Alistipes sp.]|nr:hypothetical protein [Alistipes sp.]
MKKLLMLGIVTCAALMVACASSESKAEEYAQQIVELGESGDLAGVEATMCEVLVYAEELPEDERVAFIARVVAALEVAEERLEAALENSEVKVEAALENLEAKIEAATADGKLEAKVDSLVMKATKVIEQNITEEKVQAAAAKIESKMRENLSEEKVQAAAEKMEEKMQSAAEAFGSLFK